MILTVIMIANAMIIVMDGTDHIGLIDDVQDSFHPSTTTTATALSLFDVGVGVEVGHTVDLFLEVFACLLFVLVLSCSC